MSEAQDFDMMTVDRIAFCELGLTPRQVDALSWRDLWVMLAGARDREKRRWQHTLLLTQAVMNHGGNGLRKPKPLMHLWDTLFGASPKTEPMDGERVRALLSSISVKADG